MARGDSQGATKEVARQLRSRWETFLREKNLNTTQQREAIVDVFLKLHEHVSIDDLLKLVRKKHPRVGYATVYRTLRLLLDSGVASARQFDDGQTRYEVAGEHHDHLICLKCGYIAEFEDAEIEELQDKIAKDLGGFKVLRHKHELYALCPKELGISGGKCPHEDRS
jgi:Fur family ferric uptake transcriptional regulator